MKTSGPWTAKNGTKYFVIPGPGKDTYVVKGAETGNTSQEFPNFQAAYIAGYKNGAP
jgi:hypothetical protein